MRAEPQPPQPWLQLHTASDGNCRLVFTAESPLCGRAIPMVTGGDMAKRPRGVWTRRFRSTSHQAPRKDLNQVISKTGALLYTAVNTTNNRTSEAKTWSDMGPERGDSERPKASRQPGTENRSQGKQRHPSPQNHVPPSLSTCRAWHSVGKRGGCRSSTVGTGRKTVQ